MNHNEYISASEPLSESFASTKIIDNNKTFDSALDQTHSSSQFDIRDYLDKLTPDGGTNNPNGDHSYYCPVCNSPNFKVNLGNGKWSGFNCACSSTSEGKRSIRNKLSPPIPTYTNHAHSRNISRKKYIYEDKYGSPILVVNRIDKSNQNKEIYQSIHPNIKSGNLDVKTAATKVVPYRLSEAINRIQESSDLIFWVEGEKCADALCGIGLQAITSLGGSNGYRSERDAGHVPGERLVVIPDLDLPGMKYAQKILDDHPGARLLKVFYNKPEMHLNYPENGGKDIADWIDAGATVDLILAGITTAYALTDQSKIETSKHLHKGSEPIRALRYTELMSLMLTATINGDDDEYMALRAQMITRYRCNDSQILEYLFKLHMTNQLPQSKANVPDCLDLSRISGMDFLIDGFIPKNDQTLIWGEAGTGKTTAALAMANAIMRGTGILDHSQPSLLGKVLFIASDSGASPVYAAMQDMGMAETPEVQCGDDQRFYLWASDQDQGMMAWCADLRGCIALSKFVIHHKIDLVIIDSCKAVCSGAGIDYASNQQVTFLLTYFKEVICPHTSVVWLNHDGVAKGASAGAKAWKEIPSMVHRISKEDRNNGFNYNSNRHWSVTKSRIGPTRDFSYELKDGELLLCANEEVLGNCLARIVDVLAGALQLEGKQSLSRSELMQRICRHGGPSQKTLDNTLSNSVRSKHPEVCRVGRGHYKLAPRIAKALEGCMTNGK